MHADHAVVQDLPASTASRLIEFECVEIVTLRSFPPQHVLVVSGTKPYRNMDVTLEPLTYVRRPEYWGIEVVGRLPGGIGLAATAAYEVTLPLTGIVGTEGIEVIGATGSERREIEQRIAGYEFFRDDRPVDGELRELSLHDEAAATETYVARLHTSHVDRTTGQPVDETTELGSGLAVTVTNGVITAIRDDRPVDGVLKELAVTPNDDGTWDATLRTAYFDRVNGVAVDETADVGRRLARRD